MTADFDNFLKADFFSNLQFYKKACGMIVM